MPIFRLVICDRPGRLDPFEQLLREAIVTCNSRIPQIFTPKDFSMPSVDVVAYVNPAFTIQGLGIGGYSPSANVILLSVNSEFPELELSLREELPGTLAHELHHCIRWGHQGYGTTLMEALVTEGLACDFERTFRSGTRARYIPDLSLDTRATLMKLAAGELDSTSYRHNDWFFGSREREIPPCAGYALGLFLVDNYKLATGRRTEEIVNLTAAEVKRTTLM